MIGSYRRLIFKREDPQRDFYRSQWGVYRGTTYLGSVYSLHTGGWSVVGGARGYGTRYEAGCRIYDNEGVTNG